jgi:hypothetical protein
MIYRVYSDFETKDNRIEQAILSWQNKDLINIGIKDSQLERNLYGLPYLKDLIDIAISKCVNDDDIVIYTNSDINLVSDFLEFPKENFFSVRKEVDKIKNYTISDIEKLPFKHSVNCDVFGFTKKWYIENKNNIPDFIIGSPYWDLAFICLLNGKRIDNITYHVKHFSKWKSNPDQHIYNKNLYEEYCNLNGIPFSNKKINGKTFLEYMVQHYGYDYANNPKFLTFFTPSHKYLFDLQLETFYKVYKNKYSLHYKIEDQFCKLAKYHSNGWKTTQIQKISFVIDELQSMKENQIFIFCDADIIHTNDFFEEIKNYINKFDLLAQSTKSKLEAHNICSGFYIGKKNKNNLLFLKKVLKDLKNTYKNENIADQYFFNENSNMIKYFRLGMDYYNPVFNNNLNIVEQEDFDDLISKIPETVKIIHATWIIGVQNKLLFLKKCIDRFLN